VEEHHDCTHMNECQEVACSLLIASCYTAVVLDQIEESVNEISLFVKMFIILPLLVAIPLRRNHGLRPTALDASDDFIAIIALVTDNRLGLLSVDQRQCLLHVGFLAASQNERDWIAEGVNSCVNLGAEAAAGSAQRFLLLPPFAPEAC
jgi:hypothetical protein